MTIVPYGTPYADIAALKPDGVIVSPGPGDPANLDDGLDVVRGLLANNLPTSGSVSDINSWHERSAPTP